MKKWLCILLSFQIIALAPAFAAEDEFIKNTQDDIILVGAAGIGGAVLGLSTLSFYDQPSEHVANIWTSAAIGVIAGVIWVVYSSATDNQEQLTSQISTPEFKTSDRVKWHHEQAQLLTSQKVQFGTEVYRFSF